MIPISRHLKAALTLVAAAAAGMHLVWAADANLKVKIRSNAVVRMSEVMLSDLLPDSAPESLKCLAAKIDLGSAPQPGVALHVSHAQIQTAIEDQPELSRKLFIPASVEIERFHRALSSKEIVDALNAEAGRRGLKGDDPLELAGVELTAPVTVTTNHPNLRVISIQTDALRRTTQFRLVAAREPGLVPFAVIVPRLVKFPGFKPIRAKGTASLPAPGIANPGAALRAASESGTASKFVPFQPPQPKPILVEPGALATLLVTGKGFTIKAVVIPLQEGSLGQQIRVRSLTTHRVLSAEVTGRNSLRSIL